MRANSTRTKLLVWSGVGLAVVIAVPLLLAAALRDPTIEGNRRAIAAMTNADREDLERKYREYQELPESARQRLRGLHAALQRDPALGEMRARYEEWSNALTPWQRLALRSESDPEERLEIVRTAREEQERRRRREQWEQRFQNELIYRANERYKDGAIRFRRSEVSAMMELIAESVPESVLERRGVDSLRTPESDDGDYGNVVVEYVRVLIAALEYHLERSQNSQERWPAPPLMAELVREIEDEQERAWFEAVAMRGDGQVNLLESLRYGFESAWHRSLRPRHRMTEEEKEQRRAERSEERLALYESLEPDARKELQQLSPQERDRALDWRLFFKKKGEFDVQLAELKTLITKLKLRGGFVPLPPDRRPPALTSPAEGFPRPPRRDDRSRDEPRRGPRNGEEKMREPA